MKKYGTYVERLEEENKELRRKIKDLNTKNFNQHTITVQFEKMAEELIEDCKMLSESNKDLMEKLLSKSKLIDELAYTVKEYSATVDALMKLSSIEFEESMLKNLSESIREQKMLEEIGYLASLHNEAQELLFKVEMEESSEVLEEICHLIDALEDEEASCECDECSDCEGCCDCDISEDLVDSIISELRDALK